MFKPAKISVTFTNAPKIHEVRISWAKDPYGQEALDWLHGQSLRSDIDWDIDMKGGLDDHTSFWLRDRNMALLMKLTLGGM